MGTAMYAQLSPNPLLKTLLGKATMTASLWNARHILVLRTALRQMLAPVMRITGLLPRPQTLVPHQKNSPVAP